MFIPIWVIILIISLLPVMISACKCENKEVDEEDYLDEDHLEYME